MCGIAGFINYNKNSSPEVLKHMTDALQHRGPDSSGYEVFDSNNCQVGFGHRRLSIIDLSPSGAQPMRYNHLWITFNGEIYNFNKIKDELIAAGHLFHSHSDTEVILHAFAQWGIKCVERFIGMFAFVIYDQKQQEIYCVRDRAGIKPFFYYWNNGLFLFGSELKAFHKHPGFNKELDKNAVAAFMQFGYVPTPHCIFKNCFKLSPGHYLKFSLADSVFTLHKYWDVYDAYNKPKLDIPFEEAVTETENVLRSAFTYRMVSDVPVGVFLSGGYDSACLTAILQQNGSEKIKTFTIGVPDMGLNEAPYAKDISAYLGTDHHEYNCTHNEALNLLADLPYYYDEPFGDSSAIPTMLVSKMAREQVTVALSADAGDEVFAGYNRYDYMMKYGKRLNQIPGLFRKGASLAMGMVPADKIPVLKHKYNFHNRYEKLKSLLNDPSPYNLMLSLSKQFNKKQIKQLFEHYTEESPSSHASIELKEEYHSPLAYMMAIDYQTYLLDDILQKVDRASMAASLEAREPFLDHRVIEWASRLPDHYKYNQGIKKYIIKEITHKYLPKELMDRPKMGFAIPIDDWLMNDLKEKTLHYLSDDNIRQQKIFNLKYVQKLKKDFYSGRKELAIKIWYLLMFEMWYERWMKA